MSQNAAYALFGMSVTHRMRLTIINVFAKFEVSLLFVSSAYEDKSV